MSTAPTGTPNASTATALAVYGPTPGSDLEGRDVRGDAAAVLRDDLAGGPPQVQAASVVAETLPLAQDVGRRGGREGLDRREPRDEALPALGGTGSLGLLRHGLRHEDRVRVRRAPEGQRPTALRVPAEDGRAQLGRDRRAIGHERQDTERDAAG